MNVKDAALKRSPRRRHHISPCRSSPSARAECETDETSKATTNQHRQRPSSLTCCAVLIIVVCYALGTPKHYATAWTTTRHNFAARDHHYKYRTASCSSSVRLFADDPQESHFRIRDCQHAELGACADIIMSSFYNSTTQSPWRQLYRMGELNRLQQGFPYGDARAQHKMLVAATATTTPGSANHHKKSTPTILGFVDVDARTPNRPTSYSYNPRPYLSDLCVHPDHRRQGVARALIRACESFCMELKRQPVHDKTNDSSSSNNNNNKELYIHVEANNAAAVAMYEDLGYASIHNPDDPKGESILILHKDLRMGSSQHHESKENSADHGAAAVEAVLAQMLAADLEDERLVVLSSSNSTRSNDQE